MKKLTIIGSGVAGSSAQRIAKDYGWETTVIDDAPDIAASRAALATIRPQWLGANGRQIAEESWRWYQRWGSDIVRQASVSSWRKLNTITQKDWWLVNPITMLVKPDIQDRVTQINDTTIKTAQGRSIISDAVLIAVGAHDKNLYPNFKPMFGCTLINTEIEMNEPPLRIHHLRPFHSLAVAAYSDKIVLGSSIHRDKTKAEEEVWRMLHIAEQLSIVPKNNKWNLITNVRATSPEPTLPELGKPSTAIGSLARSGYGIAPQAIEKWLKSLK